MSLKLSQLSMLTGLSRHALTARVHRLFNNQDLSRNKGKQLLLTEYQARQLIEDRIHNLQGKILYIGNLKGGVSKSSLAFLLANTTSALGLRTCVIDLDVQANLTHQYMQPSIENLVFYDVISGKKNVDNVIIELSHTLHIIPSSLKNSLIQKELALQSPKHHLTWFNNLCLNFLRKNYEVLIVDTPPHLTTLNSVFCLCLINMDNVIIPCCADDFSVMGAQMFLEDINVIRASYGVTDDPKISIILNRFMQQQKTNLEILVKLGQIFPTMISNIVIKESAKMRETINHKIPLYAIKGTEIYEVLFNLLEELNIIRPLGVEAHAVEA